MRRWVGLLGLVAGCATPAQPSGAGAPASSAQATSAQEVVQSRIQEVQGCYEEALTKDQELAGRLELQLDVEADGRVSAVRVLEDSVGGGVATCAQKRMQAWVFPRSAEPFALAVPLDLTPKSPQPEAR